MKKYSYDFFPRGVVTVNTRRLIIKPVKCAKDAGPVLSFLKASTEIKESHPFVRDPVKYEKWCRKVYGMPAFFGYLRPHQHKVVVLLGLSLDRDRAIRVSYETHPDFRRRGFAAEAQTAMLKEMRKRYPSLSVAAEIEPHNKASRRLLIKQGFRPTGMRRSRMVTRSGLKVIGFRCGS